MTPTEQDKELRQKVQDIFNDCTSGWLITIKNFNGYERELGDMESEIIGDILDLIIADRKRVALEAKIDPFEFVEPCEPDCDDVRHAYHQGQWDMATRIEAKQEEL